MRFVRFLMRSAVLAGDELAAFVAASCERSGVPVKVTDPVVLEQVAVLAGARARRRALAPVS